MTPPPPLVLVLEFVRAKDPEDPFAFRFTPETYLLRAPGGDFEKADLAWEDDLRADGAGSAESVAHRGST